MFDKIMIPLDGSRFAESIVPFVVRLARPFKSEVHLIHAVDNSEQVPRPAGMALDEAVRAMTQEAAVYLERVRAGFEAQGERVHVDVVVGRPVDALLDYVKRSGIDLLAFATHGSSGLLGLTYGRVAGRLLQAAPVSVLAIRPREDGGDREASIHRIVVPLDGSALAEKALPIAAELAKHLGEPISLIRVTDVPSYMGIAGAAAQLEQQLKTEGRAYLEQQARSLRDRAIRVDTEVLIGAPALRIAEYARSHAGSVVVMSSHGRTGLGRWLMGSVAESVIREAGDPVLVVKA